MDAPVIDSSEQASEHCAFMAEAITAQSAKHRISKGSILVPRYREFMTSSVILIL